MRYGGHYKTNMSYEATAIAALYAVFEAKMVSLLKGANTTAVATGRNCITRMDLKLAEHSLFPQLPFWNGHDAF